MEYLYLLISMATSTIFVFFLVLNHFLKKNETFIIPINWPVIGMLPHLLLNVHHFHDWVTRGLHHLSDSTFVFKGPWFSTIQGLVTTDPLNVHYVTSKNFGNYPKGTEFSEIFDILGESIFNVDFEPWRYHRKIIHSLLGHPCFLRFLVNALTHKVEKELIPILEDAYKKTHVIDLEDLFQKFAFDIICKLVTGADPRCLNLDCPEAKAPLCKAMDAAEEVLFRRYAIPKSVWKLQRRLGIGSERKLKGAWEVLDEFIYKAVRVKQEELKKKERESNLDDHHGLDMLTLHLDHNSGLAVDDHGQENKFSDKFLRDMFLSLLVAGRDSTSVSLTWFFFLLHKNKRVEEKIREELESVASKESIGKFQGLDKLVYLHGALCETLRLYPPVPLELKTPIKPDILPTGHRVSPNMKIVFSLYAMGRDESIWGDDCLEFKPERWITQSGRVKHEPSYKFFAFNSGPRTCLGKDMAFIQLKVIVASILLSGFHFHVVEEHKVEPVISIILHTKHGLKVKVLKESC